MDRMSEIKNRVTKHDHQFFVFAHESAGQRAVIGLCNNAVSHPLPKLCLRGPELFAVSTNDARGFLLLLLRLLLFLFLYQSLHPFLTGTRVRPEHVTVSGTVWFSPCL